MDLNNVEFFGLAVTSGVVAGAVAGIANQLARFVHDGVASRRARKRQEKELEHQKTAQTRELEHQRATQDQDLEHQRTMQRRSASTTGVRAPGGGLLRSEEGAPAAGSRGRRLDRLGARAYLRA